MLISDLVADVRPDVYGAPTMAMQDALQKAIVEFFQKSGAWTLRVDDLTIAAGDNELLIDCPSGARIERVLDAKVGGSNLKPMVERDFFRLADDATGTPRCYTLQQADGSMRLWPTPTEDVTASLIVVVVPKREITVLPDSLAERWRDGIVAGAKARIMRAPGKPWSQPELSSYHQRVFDDELVKAKASAFAGGYTAPRRAQFIPFV